MADGTTTPQDFYDLGINVEGGGNMLAPRISRSDFIWQDAIGDPTEQYMAGSGGDSGQWQETRANPNYKAAGYYLSPEARARLGQWTKDDPTSISWGGGAGGTEWGRSFSDYFGFSAGGAAPTGLTQNNQGELGTWVGGGDNPTWQAYNPTASSREAADKAFNDFWNQQSLSGMVKTGDKKGTGVQWVREGDSFVPKRVSQPIGWNTNPDHTQAALAAAAFASLGLSAPAMAAAGGLGQAGTGLSLLNFASGGNIPYLGTLSSLTNLAGGIGNLATNGINSLADIGKLAGTGMKAYSLGNNLFGNNNTAPQSSTPQRARTQMIPPQTGNQYNETPTTDAGYGYSGGGTPSGGGTSSGESGFTSYPGGNGGSGSSTSGDFDWGNLWNIITGGAGGGNTGLLDIWGAMEGSRQAKDQGLKLQQWYTDELGRRQPHLDRLNASYTDPNTFYDSNQWKGLSSVYKNSIDRGAAKTGTLSNPTAREVLLQQHAMKALEDYRTGLRGNASVINPNQLASVAMRGAQLEAGANNPYGALGGRGGVGGPGLNGGQGGIGRLINDISRSVGGFQNLPRTIQDLFRQTPGTGSNPNHGGTFETDYPYEESTWGMGSANPDEYGMDGPTGTVSGGDFYDTSQYGSDSYGDVTPDWNNPNFDPFSGNADFEDYTGMGMGFSNPDEYMVEDLTWLDDIGDWFDW